MFLLGFRRKLTALALCKSIESAIQWFQMHHRITFATMQNPAVYLSGARVSIFSTLVPRLIRSCSFVLQGKVFYSFCQILVSIQEDILIWLILSFWEVKHRRKQTLMLSKYTLYHDCLRPKMKQVWHSMPVFISEVIKENSTKKKKKSTVTYAF